MDRPSKELTARAKETIGKNSILIAEDLGDIIIAINSTTPLKASAASIKRGAHKNLPEKAANLLHKIISEHTKKPRDEWKDLSWNQFVDQLTIARDIINWAPSSNQTIFEATFRSANSMALDILEAIYGNGIFDPIDRDVYHR